MGRLARLFGTHPPGHRRTLDGFVDSLLQTFENSRPGLTAEMLAKGGVEAFFRDLYEKEVRAPPGEDRPPHPPLRRTSSEELFQRVDERIRKVVLPAYARLASTLHAARAERLLPDARGAARPGAPGLGARLGLPSAPSWSGRPSSPSGRRSGCWSSAWAASCSRACAAIFALRRYQQELNDLVTRTDDEIWRLDLGYMTAACGARARAGGRERPRHTGGRRRAARPRVSRSARATTAAPARARPREGRGH